jgi:hypothetical protein
LPSALTSRATAVAVGRYGESFPAPLAAYPKKFRSTSRIASASVTGD